MQGGHRHDFCKMTRPSRPDDLVIHYEFGEDLKVYVHPSSILKLKQRNVKVHSSWKAWHAKCKGSFILDSIACKCSYQHVARRKNLTCLICKSQVMFAAFFCAQTDLACCNVMMR